MKFLAENLRRKYHPIICTLRTRQQSINIEKTDCFFSHSQNQDALQIIQIILILCSKLLNMNQNVNIIVDLPKE